MSPIPTQMVQPLALARESSAAERAESREETATKSRAPALLITIDTEEEFDWNRSPYGQPIGVSHMLELPRLQDMFEAEGARPTYVCDYPILTDESSIDVLHEFLRRGTCEIGTHLHPWVNPPITETPEARHTYLCNLPLELQQAKVENVTAAFRDALGQTPRSFKAGRYGIDWRLGPLLKSLGYVVDGSAVAYTDFGDDGGPDFRNISPWPFRWSSANEIGEGLLEVPCSVGYTRGALSRAHWLHNAIATSALRHARLIGVLWHTRLLRKVFLSPEVHRLPDLLAGLVALKRAEAPVFHVSLHSPSIVPGHTPYVRTKADRDQLLVTLQTLIRFARQELGATCQTLTEFARANGGTEMIVLGISPLDKDATVTLMIDGRIVSAVAEERFSRQKMHSGFPYQALEMALRQGRVEPRDVDCVAYAFFDARTERNLMRREVASDWNLNRSRPAKRISQLIAEARGRLREREIHVPGLARGDEKMEKSWWKRAAYRWASSDGFVGDLINAHQFGIWRDQAAYDHRNYEQQLIAGLCEYGLGDKLARVEHHITHAANAFYCSGYERALIVTIDAYGSGLSATISVGDASGIRRIDTLATPYSLGSFYESVTSALGFRPDRHAGKIVGLAAYGDPEVLGDVLRGLIVWDGPRPRWRRSSDVYLARRLACEFPKVHVAAAYQTVLEEIVERWVGHYVAETGHTHVVLSGGVAANVKLNQRVHELPGVSAVYVHPNMGDGGCGTGAAIMKSLERGCKISRLESVYLGPDYSTREMHAALKRHDLPYSWHGEIEEEIARLLAENHVVARFNGAMEYGPRALGNRSILYPATDPRVNQWLNDRLHRTEFMPFAPATLAEDAPQCYEHLSGGEFAARFMTITFDCTPQMKRDCPAAVHIDGTARPQLVSAQSNLSFYRILTAYKRLTGLSSVINTSFNMHEEPIVCSPNDAIRSFLAGGIDYLAMGDFLIAAPHAPRRESPVREVVTV